MQLEHFEKKLGTQRIYEGRIINLRNDTVELENGNEASREVIEHSGGVGVLAVDDQENILLVRQFRYPTGQSLLEIPAGKRSPGEDPLACGIRELEEETGCVSNNVRPLGELYPTPAYCTEVIYLFLATGLTATAQHLDEDEFLTVERVPARQVLQWVLEGKIPDAKTQIAVLRYFATKEQGV